MDRLREEAASVISETVVPAYREFLQFFTDEYMPAASRLGGARGSVRALFSVPIPDWHPRSWRGR